MHPKRSYTRVHEPQIRARHGTTAHVCRGCRADVAHIRHSRPDSGRGFQVKTLKLFKLFFLRSETVKFYPLAWVQEPLGYLWVTMLLGGGSSFLRARYPCTQDPLWYLWVTVLLWGGGSFLRSRYPCTQDPLGYLWVTVLAAHNISSTLGRDFAELGTCKTVKARFWLWLSGEIP